MIHSYPAMNFIKDLINGERFFAQEQLCYSDETTKSINRRAVAVYDYLAKAHPTWDADEVAESMGYTASAIERIRDAELCQEDGYAAYDGEVPDDDDTGAAGDAMEDGVGGFDFG